MHGVPKLGQFRLLVHHASINRAQAKELREPGSIAGGVSHRHQFARAVVHVPGGGSALERRLLAHPWLARLPDVHGERVGAVRGYLIGYFGGAALSLGEAPHSPQLVATGLEALQPVCVLERHHLATDRSCGVGTDRVGGGRVWCGCTEDAGGGQAVEHEQ